MFCASVVEIVSIFPVAADAAKTNVIITKCRDL